LLLGEPQMLTVVFVGCDPAFIELVFVESLFLSLQLLQDLSFFIEIIETYLLFGFFCSLLLFVLLLS
jgi:hypothetical protein